MALFRNLRNRISPQSNVTPPGLDPLTQGAVDRADAAIVAGHGLEDQGQFSAALDRYREAVLIAPTYPRAHLNVGNALRLLRREGEAVAAFREALRHAPDYAPAHFNLGTLLAVAGDYAGARECLQEALRLQPDMVGKVLDAESFLLFSSGLRGDVDPEALAREHFRVGAAIAQAAGPPFTTWSNRPDPERTLRIGYVSGDFAPHPVALFLRPMLQHCDRARFEVYCYSNTGAENPIATSFQPLVTCWREISGVDDPTVAESIRADAIDILIDLNGHTERNRLGVFARHPAPVQVTWLGYLNTSGLRAMDYRICDSRTDPSGISEALHTERLYRMPHTQWCYTPWNNVPLIAQPHADEPDALIFGSFNLHIKISDLCLDLWARVFHRLPDARIVVLDIDDPHARESMIERLVQRGIEASRIDVRGRETIPAYYAAIGNVDLALDTIPHNGGTTTFDVLWMGVPVVALHGDRGISRSSYSILQSLSLLELIARSPDEYVELNVRLARDREWRNALRSTLRGRLAASPLMDVPRFVADLEAGYRQMWQTWCASHASEQ
jgi:protein O-GlcNAc transferase